MTHHPLDITVFKTVETGLASPMAGTDASLAITAQPRILVQEIRFTLTTDATVANRQVEIRFVNAMGTTVYSPVPYLQPASTSIQYILTNGSQPTPPAAPINNQIFWSFGQDLYIDLIISVDIHIINMQATDDISISEWCYRIWQNAPTI